jgi:hypothetical protein
MLIFYLILLRVSAVNFSHHQLGILVRQKVKKEEALLTNNRFKIVVKVMIIIPEGG